MNPNLDRESVVMTVLDRPVIARSVKLKLSTHNVAGRFELVGYPIALSYNGRFNQGVICVYI